MRATNPVITLLDSETREVLVFAPLSKTRLNALVKAYSRAGIEAVIAQAVKWGQGLRSCPCFMSKRFPPESSRHNQPTYRMDTR